MVELKAFPVHSFRHLYVDCEREKKKGVVVKNPQTAQSKMSNRPPHSNSEEKTLWPQFLLMDDPQSPTSSFLLVSLWSSSTVTVKGLPSSFPSKSLISRPPSPLFLVLSWGLLREQHYILLLSLCPPPSIHPFRFIITESQRERPNNVPDRQVSFR